MNSSENPLLGVNAEDVLIIVNGQLSDHNCTTRGQFEKLFLEFEDSGPKIIFLSLSYKIQSYNLKMSFKSKVINQNL